MNFHDEKNGWSYTAREADASWMQLIRKQVNVQGKRVADIGCGGGIYSKAMLKLGASHVTGVDFSQAMLQGAEQFCGGLDNIRFVQGTADQTSLADGSMEIVLERALIHHLEDLEACFREANRILVQGGCLIVQDRTPDDTALPGNVQHIRGYFFEVFPELMVKEAGRRHSALAVKRRWFRMDLSSSMSYPCGKREGHLKMLPLYALICWSEKAVPYCTN